MSDPIKNPEFAGSIPELYDRYLVPLLFEWYAQDIASRVRQLDARSVLEVAAGSGVVTRAMADALDAGAAITATDLSGPMIDQARAAGTSRPVEWGTADAMALPYDADTFDVVVSQFGVMFVPDMIQGFAEMRRVLRPGGTVIVSVWDHLGNNGFSNAVQDALEGCFPSDPPRFLPDGAFGYHDQVRIHDDFAGAGFSDGVALEVLDHTSRSPSAEQVAVAMCQGGPVRTEIEIRDPSGLERVTAAAAELVRERYGSTDVEAPMRAIIATARKA
jgi:SAM-dependent methyltransferase